MDDPLDDDLPVPAEASGTGGQIHDLTIPDDADGLRLDKALAEAAAGIAGLSRSRLADAIAAGRVTDPSGATVTAPRAKVKAGAIYRVTLPEPAPARPEPEDIPLVVVHEDADLIVIDKPAGMVVHPAPGAERGTLVNALLAHCGGSLAGIGGERRPGIVHRIDKDTSGLLVAAKTEAAMAGLAALFATHDIEREYRAILWGMPDRAEPRLAGLPGVSFEDGWIRVEAALARHPVDRKRMAVARSGGRHAVTRLRLDEGFGAPPFASLATFRLETGRTHQIRVHAAHIGHPLVGDPVYGRPRRLSPDRVDEGTRAALAAFPRQALHATRLGFQHPVTGAYLDFESPIPSDMNTLLCLLRRNPSHAR
ncbi:RluA family pseudouridine synthase [Limibaculum sp. M0105]|uniref:Pseudouridine synthase n=1 Tax=Thermohalobaculum xanthum TaxID=2753746 RepID=A0A8J7M560_9RHOB|nr:RluA family pseudouridine synthase [Thermohalobaculum xanthum]MBK0397927.1 RluA family pseudouridine synthase [Thermohalobaculum xanthum]